MYDHEAQKKYRKEKIRVRKFHFIDRRPDEKRLADLLDKSESKKGFVMEMFSVWEHYKDILVVNNRTKEQ
tara:strand:- start:730 stop:939 length:210 start_codon:yes stop_codon:yes gene_type:complete